MSTKQPLNDKSRKGHRTSQTWGVAFLVLYYAAAVRLPSSGCLC